MSYDASKITVLRSGIDISKFEYRARHANPEQQINIISIARLVEMKGIHYTIPSLILLGIALLIPTYQNLNNNCLTAGWSE